MPQKLRSKGETKVLKQKSEKTVVKVHFSATPGRPGICLRALSYGRFAHRIPFKEFGFDM
jgi:hypothetical protein